MKWGRNVMRRRRNILAAIIICLAISVTYIVGTKIAEAVDTETVMLRILATSDLHGQMTAYNYETGEEDREVGLSKLITLLRDARKEAASSNTLLVDAGDVLYDYSTNYFYDNLPDTVQPIYQMMSKMNYDFVTLGNHEMDYPIDYIKKQLQDAGLYDKLAVCNLFYDETGDTVFSPYKIITREMVTSEGNKVTVTIGIIGATRGYLTNKRQRYTGYIDADDIYNNVKLQSEALKEVGVDVVVAVIHGGIGVLSGSDTTEHPGARIAALSTVDAVITGHSHEAFPANDGTYMFYNTVNESKGLVEGKPVVGMGSHAYALGVIDLELRVADDGTISIKSGSSSLRTVSAELPEDQEIMEFFESYQEILDASIDYNEYPVADGIVYTNLDCAAQDSALFQLINNAKIEYGKTYVQTNLKEYADYPIIAVTANLPDNKADYVVIEDTIGEQDIAKMIAETSALKDSGYIYIYKITGKKLREWLEFSASIYAKQGTKPAASIYSGQASILITENNLSQLERMFFFDGIEYEIDLTKQARYNQWGSLVSASYSRIKNLTYNGIEVTDDQIFLLVSEAFNVRYSFMPTSSDMVYTTFPWDETKYVILDYIKGLAEFGDISITADNNWHFASTMDGGTFIFGTGPGYDTYISTQDWYGAAVTTQGAFRYYLGNYYTPEKMMEAVLSQDITATTEREITVTVNIITMPEGVTIQKAVYLFDSVYDENDAKWSSAAAISNMQFKVWENGVYSVLLTDSTGNKHLLHKTIDNIYYESGDKILVRNVSNRMQKVYGTATPGCAVIVKMEDGSVYYDYADSETGSFSVQIDAQKANSIIKVYCDTGERIIGPATTTVYRTAPNQPTVTECKIGSTCVKGVVEPGTTPILIRAVTVYVPTGCTDVYKNSSIYDSSLIIVETDVIINNDGSFVMTIPTLNKGNVITLYSCDWQNRTSLRAVRDAYK